MEKRITYQKPESGRIAFSDPIMLELPISDGFVDEEAANQNSTFEEEEITGGAHDFQLWEE